MRLDNLIWAILIISAVLPLGLVNAATQDFAAISVTPLKYEPFPAQPGSYLKLWINVQNTGIRPAENLVVVLEPEYPFSLDPSENSTIYVQKLEGMNNALIDYKIRVADDAVEGTNDLKLRYSTGDSSVWVEKIITINIQTLRANLEVSSVKNQYVSPGNVTPLEISLKNKGDSSLQDISVKLDLSNVPFYAINSIAEKKLYIINASNEDLIGFDIMASPTAKCQPYQIPITLSYKTLDGTQFTKSDFITLIVNSSPTIVVDLESSDILTGGSTGSLILNLVNKGLTDIKFLTVTLNPGNYDIISPSQVYIGNLNSDDFDTAQFKIYARNSNSSVPLNVSIDYRDGNNNVYSEDRIIPLRVYSSEELSKYNLVAPPNYTGLVIIVIVLALVVYWFYRRRRKRK